MDQELAPFRAALKKYDDDASRAVDDELLRKIVIDQREENPESNDQHLERVVCTTAYHVAHEAIIGS